MESVFNRVSRGKRENRIMQGHAWSFIKFLASLKEWVGDTMPKDINFFSKPFWIQFHVMPFFGMNKTLVQ